MGFENLFYVFRLSGRLRQVLLYIRRDIDEVWALRTETSIVDLYLCFISFCISICMYS